MSTEDTEERLQRIEEREWLESFEYVLHKGGPARVHRLLLQLHMKAAEHGVEIPYAANTPFINTIPREKQPAFPGKQELERRIKSLIRWNAMAMVVHANREDSSIGGHISTYASAATLYEVAFNHFLRAPSDNFTGDHVYYQGHASPGIYARAFLEGRLSQDQLRNFRREMAPSGGLPSYPHAWLMPDFWEYATVSMGLGPIQGIYQARFNRYLEDRGLLDGKKTGNVWVFMGDGETDEPESLGAINLASREKLDNLIFVINCNLQRLDGPVRGNGKIIQELEAMFRGAGWNVVKAIWSRDWDPLLERDEDGALVRRMNEVVDGELQKLVVESGEYVREHFFGTNEQLKEMVSHLSGEELKRLRRGGHDPEKVYAAYDRAVREKGRPSVILAMTVKGYGLGEAGEGKNITHKQKQLNEAELKEFRSRFAIPISDDEINDVPFHRPSEVSPEIRYLKERREELGGYLPARSEKAPLLEKIPDAPFERLLSTMQNRDAATTLAMVRLLSFLLKDETLGKQVVPIVPDEARTFGMETLFRSVGIYSHVGQKYEPVDADTLLSYNEQTTGQILEEGITEAGAMSSFIAAGTAYSSLGLQMIPFFFFYSMFGFQRIGDLIWAAGDMRTKGFLIGATSGRTTLAGEGLQHQDGHSHLLAFPNPRIIAYDPAYAYELAVIVRDGMRRMFVEDEALIYYITVGNESYEMPPMPDNVEDQILRGMYCLSPSQDQRLQRRIQLLGSGAILNEVRKAAKLLEEEYEVAADVYSVTSYKQLHTEALDAERWNRFNPGKKPRIPYISQSIRSNADAVVAASDYVKMLPYSVAQWVDVPFIGLGTDGFGRSETREALRDFFEVDHRHIVLAALSALRQAGKVDEGVLLSAMETLEINPNKPNPTRS